MKSIPWLQREGEEEAPPTTEEIGCKNSRSQTTSSRPQKTHQCKTFEVKFCRLNPTRNLLGTEPSEKSSAGKEQVYCQGKDPIVSLMFIIIANFDIDLLKIFRISPNFVCRSELGKVHKNEQKIAKIDSLVPPTSPKNTYTQQTGREPFPFFFYKKKINCFLQTQKSRTVNVWRLETLVLDKTLNFKYCIQLFNMFNRLLAEVKYLLCVCISWMKASVLKSRSEVKES